MIARLDAGARRDRRAKAAAVGAGDEKRARPRILLEIARAHRVRCQQRRALLPIFRQVLVAITSGSVSSPRNSVPDRPVSGSLVAVNENGNQFSG